MNSLFQLAILISFCASSAYSAENKKPQHRCRKHEHFTVCRNDCPTPVCADPRPALCPIPECQYGCDCNKGYVRIKKPNGLCIRRDFAFKECGSRCNITCEQILKPDPSCKPTCHPGCFCKQGVYSTQFGKCMPPEACRVPDC